ncbi:PCI domain-containing protein [Toxoplasma gondii ME49]|uniref:Eukaryotic translation initiation factor 3 subunit M n=23 Tax=Toxoplasma gondii TaxID=5811 RepID=B9PQ71_TOXGV|nr:PCI domain-containing protein [Toxoplasma gondii ME49]EPR63767.1 PCI domain-containing protein [Toxoplasma gondii GT1]ESS34073.1 PCI domain-containing protein [Toxoplasma gondii VEG]KAF4638375.1 PCI domain-containing protein [Toxoplasma gondii]KFG47246.1 PCI domain-containing protein [Toxoplasma gondii GAB2-2007-GAL-DOM2]KFH15911.1 PCI domain-containing protein [Toxoplasma gondii MAS]PIM04869.1 PCI domain-containing protein [Toxoplasma gondii COUG]RQX71847.1 PCI domain-containing protein |eukprot:XP_002371349.1 PCI domain-containing protein [Toxoplasma gondii ME49]
MTTFVPLATDGDGTASAVAVGDWLLQIINLKNPSQTQSYYTQFLEQFDKDEETGEQKIRDHFQLFELLLSQHQLVFNYATQARQPAAAEKGEKPQNRKTFLEAVHEVEEFFTVLIAMVVLRIENVEQAGQAAGTLCSVFRASTDMAEFRLRLLQSLYNAFPPSFPYRFPIFVATLEYAAETNLFSVMLPYIRYINEWMRDWNLPPSSKRQVFLILANELKKLKKADEAYPFLKRHVQFFQNEKEEILSNGATISAAVELVEDSIRLPDVIVFDGLMDLHAVVHLRKTAHAPLIELLQIFVNQGPKELEAFKNKHPQVFEEHGLNYEQCLGKIRLLAVASLVHGRKKEVSIRAIGDALQLSEAGAEEVAVQAIGQGIVDAKIDQLARVLHVRSTMQREFGRQQWEELLERIDHWSEGVRALMGCMQSVKNQVASAAASAAGSSPGGLASPGASLASGGIATPQQ